MVRKIEKTVKKYAYKAVDVIGTSLARSIGFVVSNVKVGCINNDT